MWEYSHPAPRKKWQNPRLGVCTSDEHMRAKVGLQSAQCVSNRKVEQNQPTRWVATPRLGVTEETTRTGSDGSRFGPTSALPNPDRDHWRWSGAHGFHPLESLQRILSLASEVAALTTYGRILRCSLLEHGRGVLCPTEPGGTGAFLGSIQLD